MKTEEVMKIGRRKFLKSLALAGAIATMGISGCVSEPEPIPVYSMPTRTAPALSVTATPSPTPTANTDLKKLPDYDEYYKTLIKKTLIDGHLDVKSAYIIRGKYITKAGLYIIDGSYEGISEKRALFLSYISSANTKEELALETGSITHTFVDLVRNGWDIDAIIIALGDEDNNIIGTWHCEGSWVRNYLDGSVKKETLYTQIMNTHKFIKNCHAPFSTLDSASCHAF